ncbi:hypothetical protein MTBBW1_2730005 [Desulfamplus magnetovallimortis]|uniref:Uncharacterized protein n=1 Tax=Desulfamplus magnetovallimortis TaxID=1246637 RepID=A0A1W1HFI0_9BACT|nr:hypothetical protein [Desulfamplus magnetovallimortis]SLM31135.1 hypothetical protein MTBBW1_2730005 [Desulfamplus magnetovallimortis]
MSLGKRLEALEQRIKRAEDIIDKVVIIIPVDSREPGQDIDKPVKVYSACRHEWFRLPDEPDDKFLDRARSGAKELLPAGGVPVLIAGY